MDILKLNKILNSIDPLSFEQKRRVVAYYKETSGALARSERMLKGKATKKDLKYFKENTPRLK